MTLNRTALSVILIGGFIGSGLLFGGIESINASLEASLGAVLCSFILSLTALFYPRTPRKTDTTKPVKLLRRFFAFYVDFVVFLSLYMSIYASAVAFIEYLATGTWQWEYQRDNWQTRDWIGLFLLILGYIFGFQYFLQHLKKGKETPGQYILGYKIIQSSESATPKHSSRVWGGLFALWASIFTLIIYRNVEDGVYWWDKQSNTRAVRTIP